jgi:hypothetical protein
LSKNVRSFSGLYTLKVVICPLFPCFRNQL